MYICSSDPFVGVVSDTDGRITLNLFEYFDIGSTDEAECCFGLIFNLFSLSRTTKRQPFLPEGEGLKEGLESFIEKARRFSRDRFKLAEETALMDEGTKLGTLCSSEFFKAGWKKHVGRLKQTSDYCYFEDISVETYTGLGPHANPGLSITIASTAQRFEEWIIFVREGAASLCMPQLDEPEPDRDAPPAEEPAEPLDCNEFTKGQTIRIAGAQC